ncbi:hypothetical protein [Streptomyces similanensis]|uniref:Uncharacterized protein n=1 Tax=Streptomyces similanensis TaxID=1274988 RepID=A0ABP9L805_9ACTN
MPSAPGTLKFAAYALLLMALAHPALVPPALAVVAVGLALAHLSLVLTVATVTVLLVRAFPDARRWLVRAWDASVDAVARRFLDLDTDPTGNYRPPTRTLNLGMQSLEP